MIRVWCALWLALAAPLAQGQAVQAVTEDTAYTYIAGGRVAGPATAVVRAALDRAGLADARFDLYPWARAYEMAMTRPNVLIYLIARTPEREPHFKWVGELMKIEYHLYKLASRKDIAITSIEQARDLTVGVMRRDVRQQYLARKGFAYLEVSAGNEENFRKLLAGRVDLVPLPQADVVQLCEKLRVDCSTVERVLTLDELTVGLYMAFGHLTDDQVVARLRAGYEALLAEGGRVGLQ